ncbi:general secretion pathway protein GspB [Thalassomonas sp. M1454]|uniref:general secretion pathway protein GspB n=1 Tax=Thalassomonas sp. M1454 TaxID=2594477 RepID=UPI00117BE04B|nr:general secretion pathway protein GspB [Thalassomonas sp. M1454]TRX53904.1 hypothetical protein FNN08_13185 [Thalassomonas sp. M1454]
MSYILDALKKDQKSLSALDFNEVTGNVEASDESNKNYFVLIVKILFLIILSILIGFYFAGGQKLVAHYTAIDHEVTEIATARVDEEQPLENNFQAVDTNVHGYFTAVDDFNKQLIANKKFAEMQRQQQLLEQEQLKQKQQQELLAQQVQLALKDSNVMIAQGSNKRKSPLAPGKSVKKEPVKLTLNQDELEGVSPELLLAFQSALDDSNNESELDKPQQSLEGGSNHENVDEQLKSIGQMPSWYQDSLPTLRFTLHMYAVSAEDSWVRLNGKDYYSGEQTDEGLIIEQILPQKLILQYQGERFTMKALSNW